MMRATDPDLFWSHVDKSGDCWVWTGRRSHRGQYGVVRVHAGTRGGRPRRRELYAHRVAWTLSNGDIPAGMLVCHRCDNPPCVRPEHLFLGSDRDNHMDARAKGRASYQRPGFTTRSPSRSPAIRAYWADRARSDAHRGRLREALARRRAA